MVDVLKVWSREGMVKVLKVWSREGMDAQEEEQKPAFGEWSWWIRKL
jgi:hypothetical protein